MGHHHKIRNMFSKSSTTRKDTRRGLQGHKKGDLNRKSTHKMRTKMGMNK